MLSPQGLLRGLVARALPPVNPDSQNNDVALRLSAYGDQSIESVWTTKHRLADEGSYFAVASSGTVSPPIPGTFVAQQGQITAFGDTTPLWVIQNTAPAGGKNIYLDFLRLLLGGTAPTGTISLELAVRIDTISKLPTNSNQYTTPLPINVNGASDRAAVAKVYAYLAAQAMATPASSGAVRNVARARIPTGVAVVGDQYLFRFGTTEPDSAAATTAARATHPVSISGQANPVIIAPGQWATIHLWWLTSATNLPTWEWELGLAER